MSPDALQSGDRRPPRTARAPAQPPAVEAGALLAELLVLREAIIREGGALYERWRPRIARRSFQPSALNLAHYLALRRRDLRRLQARLAPWGLSSLGRSEARVLPNLDAVLLALGALAGAPPEGLPPRPRRTAFRQGERLLEYRAMRLFGPAPRNRRVRIMVTLPTEAATDYPLVHDLLLRGMDCARINCAHDEPNVWAAQIENVRAAQRATGRPCRVLMDLGGPRARTGAVLTPDATRRLCPGDRILLRPDEPRPEPDYPIQAQCLPAEVLGDLAVGAQVWINDGKLGGRIEALVPAGAVLRVVHTQPKGAWLEPEKGLNFPGTVLRLGALTAKDVADLEFVARRADIIGYSFVQEAVDIEQLFEALAARGAGGEQPALLLKIETARAIQNLPELIIRAKGRRPVAVMIARGDLAIEIGYERLAEMQEELLWLCEAAHVPVIWATQVLERLVKKGTPSRAEITDAAMAVRAECVMLNKGPHIVQAVEILDDVLTRMQGHHVKKSPQLRALRSWTRLIEPG